MRSFAFLAAALVFIMQACSSGSIDRRREDSRRFERSLRVGATKEEIQRAGAELTNCRGSGLSYERCETTFLQGEDPMLLGNHLSSNNEPRATNYSQDTSRSFTLHFQNGKLERWEKTDSTNLRGYP